MQQTTIFTAMYVLCMIGRASELDRRREELMQRVLVASEDGRRKMGLDTLNES
jgi:hypothetical protein